MRAIVNTRPNQLEMQNLPLPQPGPGQVRIRTGACGICATDLQMIAGWDRTGFPAIPGHEWSGTVEAVGDAGTASSGSYHHLLGQPCVAENVLSDGLEVGFEHSGGYAEYFLTEAAVVHPLPAGFSFATAALIEPLAVSVRAMRRLRVGAKPGSLPAACSALVIGDGPIGLLMLALLKRAGVKDVCLLGGRKGRLDLATEFGADHVLNYHKIAGDLPAGVLKETGQAYTVVVEASGSGAAMQASLQWVEPGGRIVIVGDYGGAQASFPWNILLHREIELIGSNASAGAWDEAVRLAIEGSLPLQRLISHRLPAERFSEAIDLTRSRSGEVVKVVMEW